jgi:hypothetical protein
MHDDSRHPQPFATGTGEEWTVTRVAVPKRIYPGEHVAIRVERKDGKRFVVYKPRHPLYPEDESLHAVVNEATRRIQSGDWQSLERYAMAASDFVPHSGIVPT